MRALGVYFAAALAVCGALAYGAQPPQRDAAQQAVCPVPPPLRMPFHTFSRDAQLLRPQMFAALHQHRDTFGHTFTHELPLLKLAAQLSIYGYDYIGSRDGYMLFKRRPVNWVQTTSIPRLAAPNGELLPPMTFPNDLDPRWPSPALIAQDSRFAGAIVLPQQIIAYPCLSS